MENKGSMLLKVISIIMIVAGAINVIAQIVLMAGTAVLQGVVDAYGATAEVNTGALWAGVIIGIIGAAVEIVAGVIGVKNWTNAEKAQTLMIIGGVVAVIGLISNILVMIASGFNVVSLLSGLVVPVLYVVGAVQLKNQK